MPVFIYKRKNSPIRGKTVKRCLEELLRHSKSEKAILELSYVGEKTIQKLNKNYRKKNSVTDVLSFPLDVKGPPAKGAPWHLGEIVIATGVAKRQARQSGRNLNQQVVRLAVHGLVHLQGLDHERDPGDAKRFLRREEKYLNHLNEKGMLKWDGSLQL